MYGQIYLITNRVNGKRYVGQTIRGAKTRWRSHVKMAESGAKTVFCYAIRKYGEAMFEMRAVADAPDHATLNSFEYFYIKHLDTMNPLRGYNRREGGSQPKFGPETKAKFSALRKGRKLSAEWRAKISASGKGRKVSQKSIEVNRARLLGNTLALGKKHSEETKIKMRKPKSAEHRRNISKARTLVKLDFNGDKNPFYGRKHSEETLAKMRSRVRTPEHCQRLSESHKGEKDYKFRHDVPTEKLVEMYATGMGTWTIGRAVGMSPVSIQMRLKSVGVVLRPRKGGK